MFFQQLHIKQITLPIINKWFLFCRSFVRKPIPSINTTIYVATIDVYSHDTGCSINFSKIVPTRIYNESVTTPDSSASN